MRDQICTALVGGLLALGAAPAHAAAIYVANHSFEDQALPEGGFINGFGPSGWSAGYAEPSGPLNPLINEFADPVPDGQNVMFSATGYDGSPYYSGDVYQTVASSLAANTRYTLMVDVGRSNFSDLADFAVELTGGSFLNFSILAAGSFDSLAPGEFRTLTITFDSVEAQDLPLSIRLRTMHDPDQGQGQRLAFFDNVRLDASAINAGAVPEPATWAMMILGFGGMGAVLRRRNDGASAPFRA
ncbi:MAG: PEPxxWA-CTERM sorting domain-containing protein [Pseudomonadota bacterium]